jgi:hypothetical protein
VQLLSIIQGAYSLATGRADDNGNIGTANSVMAIVLGVIVGITGIHGTHAGSSGKAVDAARHFKVVVGMALACIVTQIAFAIAINTSNEATTLTATQKKALGILAVVICIITIVCCGLCAWCGRAFQEESRSMEAPPTQGINMQATSYGQPQAMAYGQPPSAYPNQSFVMAQPQPPSVPTQAAQPPGQVYRNSAVDPSYNNKTNNSTSESSEEQ